MRYAPTIANEHVPCFNCGTDMVHAFGYDTCPDCGEMEAASIHNHSQTW